MVYFYYDFSHRSGQDLVRYDYKKIGNPWDLIQIGSRYIINLGKEISRQDLYKTQLDIGDDNKKIIWKVFGSNTLQLIHWMVYQYLTNYRSIISLYINNLPQYIKNLQKYKIQKKRKYKDKLNSIDINYNPILDKNKGQTLILMPDTLTIVNTIKDRNWVLTGKDWDSKVIKYYLEIQWWDRNLLIATHGNIRMDRKNLTNIVIFYPDTRYYKNQLDPRYDAVEVCHKLAEIRDADLKIIW